MPAYRTPVRYKGSRCGLCSYCGCSRVRQLCAYSAWYIFSWWRGPRAPLGPPLRVLNISAPFRFALRYSVSFFYIPSRFASRLASRFASRSCVLPCVPSRSSHSPSRFASRFHCLSLSTTRLSCGAPFRPACRLPSRLASRVRRLRFCLVCRPCVPPVRIALAFRHAFCSAFRHACRPVSRFAACSGAMVSMRRRSALLAAHRMPCRA